MRLHPLRIIGALSLGLVLSQIAIMAVPAVIVELSRQWSLDAVEVGWLGGIYFAGYAVGLPFLTGAADRFDGRVAYAASAAIAASASLAFAFAATGFWSALGFRFIAGIGFSGIHIIGMKLMTDRLTGATRARAAAFYSAAFAIGSGISFLTAGLLSEAFGWSAAFVAAGAGALLAAPLVLLIGPSTDGGGVQAQRRWLPDFSGALRDREVMRYVLAYAGNTWEVFAIRVWFVPFLVFSAEVNSRSTADWPPSLLAAISAFIAVPVSIAVAELAIRLGRDRVVCAVSIASVIVCLMLGWLATSPYPLILALLLVHGATSFGDAGAINGGVVAAASPEKRAAALTLFGLFGFTTGFLGPLAVGIAVEQAGGVTEPSAWLWGFAVMALGSVLAAGMTAGGRRR